MNKILLYILFLLPSFLLAQSSTIAASKKKTLGVNCPGGVCDNMVAWYIAEDVDGDGNSGNNSGDYATWADLSGNGNDLVPIRTGEPTYTSSVLNGLAGMYFNPTEDDGMSVDSVTQLINVTDVTYFLVMKNDSTETNNSSGYIGITGSGGFSNMGVFDLANFVIGSTDGGNMNILSGITISDPAVVEIVDWATVDTSYVLFNDVKSNVQATVKTNYGTGVEVFLGNNNGAITNDAEGYIMEAVFYTGMLSFADRLAIRTYLETKYGL